MLFVLIPFQLLVQNVIADTYSALYLTDDGTCSITPKQIVYFPSAYGNCNTAGCAQAYGDSNFYYSSSRCLTADTVDVVAQNIKSAFNGVSHVTYYFWNEVGCTTIHHIVSTVADGSCVKIRAGNGVATLTGYSGLRYSNNTALVSSFQTSDCSSAGSGLTLYSGTNGQCMNGTSYVVSGEISWEPFLVSLIVPLVLAYQNLF